VDQRISIKLFDQAYTFKADAEASEVDKIANYVVAEVEKAHASAKVPGKLDSVILAALNIASEYFEIKRGREELLRRIEDRCNALIENIENSL
jgi:cell division protein ZapA